jgi:hypothetical protein
VLKVAQPSSELRRALGRPLTSAGDRINTNGDPKLWSQKRLNLINQAKFSSTHFFSLSHGFSISLLSSLCLHGSHAHKLYGRSMNDASIERASAIASQRAADRMLVCMSVRARCH